ncbi:MAG: hypothetical protein Q9223_004464 [Gallowayella weberi]
MCGNDDRVILDGTPWLVANSLYHADAMVGSACTYFDRVETPAGGNPRVVWRSTTAIQNIKSTNTKGDFTSTSAQEIMIWLEWEGGQLPIGWDSKPKSTINNLFGTSWKVYEDVNTGNGMTVHSMLPDTQYSGSFTGDLKDAFEALVRLGRFSSETYVNVGNAG